MGEFDFFEKKNVLFIFSKKKYLGKPCTLWSVGGVRQNIFGLNHAH